MIGLDVTHRAVTTPALQERLRARARSAPLSPTSSTSSRLPPRDVRLGRCSDPRRRGRRTRRAARARDDRRAQRRDRARLGPLSRPHRRRPLAADRPARERPCRRRPRHRRRSSTFSSSGSARSGRDPAPAWPLSDPSEFEPEPDGGEPGGERAHRVRKRLADLAGVEQAVGVEGQRREGRVGPEKARHHGGPDPGLILERGSSASTENPIRNAPVTLTTKMPHGNTDSCASDRLVDAVARDGPEGSCERDADDDGHPRSIRGARALQARCAGTVRPPWKRLLRMAARKKKPVKRAPRPRTPARVKKRTRKSRSHHHPELWGLGMVAVGVFLATLSGSGWDGGAVGAHDREWLEDVARRRRLRPARCS